MVIGVLDQGWYHLDKPLDTTRLKKRLDNEKFLERLKERVEKRAYRYCVSEHDAVYNIFRTTKILTTN